MGNFFLRFLRVIRAAGLSAGVGEGFMVFTKGWIISESCAERGEWAGIEGASWRGGVSGQRIVVFWCCGVRVFDPSVAALL